jgi:hypothetical protein
VRHQIAVGHRDLHQASASRPERHRTQLSPRSAPPKSARHGWQRTADQRADDCSFAAWAASPRTPASSSLYPDGCRLAAPRKSAGPGPFDATDLPCGLAEPRFWRPGVRSGRWRE